MRKLLVAFCLGALFLSGSCAAKKPKTCRNPNYAEIVKKQAVSAIQKGDFYTALEAALESETCNPRDPETQYWLGWIYLARKQFSKALEHLERALDLRKDYPEANLALGMIFLELKRWDEAIAQFEIVTNHELFREPEVAHNNIGWARLMKGEPGRAEQSFQTALSINPNYCPARCNLGEVEVKKGSSAAAIQDFQRALQVCPDYHRAHLLLGIELEGQKNIPAACREFQATIRLRPDSEEGRRAVEYIQLLNCAAPPPR